MLGFYIGVPYFEKLSIFFEDWGFVVVVWGLGFRASDFKSFRHIGGA